MTCKVSLLSGVSARPTPLVLVACGALVAGVGSPALRILAGYTGYTRAEIEMEYDTPDLLPVLLDELNLLFSPRDSETGQEFAVRVLALQGWSAD